MKLVNWIRKQKLLQQYQIEYDKYLKEVAIKQKAIHDQELLRQKQEDEAKRKALESTNFSSGNDYYSPTPTAPILTSPDHTANKINASYPIANLLSTEESAVISRKPRNVINEPVNIRNI